MTLTELQQEVYQLTNRPDLVDRTLSAVREATLTVHQSDFYWKDLYETGISFPSELALQQFEYDSVLPRFRGLSYVRKTGGPDETEGPVFSIIGPGSAIDSYGFNEPDVCYVAGSIIQFRSSTPFQYAILGCYLHPDITVSGYSSWVAKDHPFAIINIAAARIFRSIGKLEEHASANQEAQFQLQRVRISNIVAQGY